MSGEPIFAGIGNFRDFGGHATPSGRMVRGRLFRSAAHHEATDEDLAALKALGVEVIVDLRHPTERQREACRRWPGFAAEVIQNDWEETFPSWADVLREHAPSVEVLREHKLAWYGQMAVEPNRADLFARCLAALAATDRRVLIHCSAGKDRTGVLVALVQHAAGASWDDITSDFLRSNDEGFLRRRAAQTAATLERLSGIAPDPATVRAAMAVERHYLEAAFQGMASRYGSVDAYFEQPLGFGPSERAALQARLLG